MGLITVSQYAAKHGANVSTVRAMAASGKLPAQKIGNQWVMEESTPWPEDRRVKSGKYRDWRKQTNNKEQEEPSS